VAPGGTVTSSFERSSPDRYVPWLTEKKTFTYTAPPVSSARHPQCSTHAESIRDADVQFGASMGTVAQVEPFQCSNVPTPPAAQTSFEPLPQKQ
jgi:hypothetical protein